MGRLIFCETKSVQTFAMVRPLDIGLHAYFCSSMEEDAQIAELKRLQERSREGCEEA